MPGASGALTHSVMSVTIFGGMWLLVRGGCSHVKCKRSVGVIFGLICVFEVPPISATAAPEIRGVDLK